MEKEKRILFYFVGWFIVGICIFLIGVINVKADTYDSNQFEAQLYDNINGSLSSVTTYQESGASNYHYGYIGLTANSSGGAWGVSSPIPLIANHTYSMTVDPFVPGCGFTILSTYNRIGVGTSMSNAKTSYQNNTNVNEKFSKAISNSQFLQFVFTPTINASYIVFAYSTTSSCSSTTNQLSNIIIEDLGESGVSQDQINTSLTNQTNELNNSINNSTNIITGEIDNLGEDIKDSIKDNFNSCEESKNLSFKVIEGYEINSSDGGTKALSTWLVTDYIPVISGVTYTISGFSSNLISFYDSNKFFIGNNRVSQFTPIENAKYIRLNSTIDGYNGVITQGEVCSNKIDQTNDKLDETNNQLGDLNDNLNNDNVDGSLDSAGSFFDSFTTTDHGGLSGIITAPLVAINEMLNTSCSPMTATFKGKEISLPCGYEFWGRLGAIQSFINLVLGGMLCYNIVKKLFKLIERIKNPEDDRVEVMDL